MTSLTITRERPEGFDQCLICLKDRATTGTYAVGSCSTAENAHAFCVECIETWAQQQQQTHPTCPFCRGVLQNLEQVRGRWTPLEELVERVLNKEFEHPGAAPIKEALERIVDLEHYYSQSPARKLLIVAPLSTGRGGALAIRKYGDWAQDDFLKRIETLSKYIFFAATISLFGFNLAAACLVDPNSRHGTRVAFEGNSAIIKYAAMGLSLAFAASFAEEVKQEVVLKWLELSIFRQLHYSLAAGTLIKLLKACMHPIYGGSRELLSFSAIFALMLTAATQIYIRRNQITAEIENTKREFREARPLSRFAVAGTFAVICTLLTSMALFSYENSRAKTWRDEEQALSTYNSRLFTSAVSSVCFGVYSALPEWFEANARRGTLQLVGGFRRIRTQSGD